MYKQEQVKMLADNPKIQAAGATFTTLSGIGTIAGYLSPILAVVATTIGIVFTWVMINKGRAGKKSELAKAVLAEAQTERSNLEAAKLRIEIAQLERRKNDN